MIDCLLELGSNMSLSKTEIYMLSQKLCEMGNGNSISCIVSFILSTIKYNDKLAICVFNMSNSPNLDTFSSIPDHAIR